MYADRTFRIGHFKKHERTTFSGNKSLQSVLVCTFFGYDSVDISSHLSQKYTFVLKHLELIFLHKLNHGQISKNIQLSLRQK